MQTLSAPRWLLCTRHNNRFKGRGRAPGQRVNPGGSPPLGPASLREHYLNQVQRDCLSRGPPVSGGRQHP